MDKALAADRRFQADEQLAAGESWHDNDLVVATLDSRHVSPRNVDQSFERVVRDLTNGADRRFYARLSG